MKLLKKRDLQVSYINNIRPRRHLLDLLQITEFQLEIKNLDHEIKKLQDDFKTCKHKEAEYGEKEYDNKHLKEAQELSDNSAKELEEKIRNCNQKRTKLSRTVNAKGQSMFEHAEIQYNELLKKKAIVGSDERELMQIMTDLDNKKAKMSVFGQYFSFPEFFLV